MLTWHSGADNPEDGVDLLIETVTKSYVLGRSFGQYYEVEFECYGTTNTTVLQGKDVKRWCYMKDLLEG